MLKFSVAKKVFVFFVQKLCELCVRKTPKHKVHQAKTTKITKKKRTVVQANASAYLAGQAVKRFVAKLEMAFILIADCS